MRPYAEPIPTEATRVTNVTITIGGSVINSPIAVADVITGSFNTLVESRASDELKDWLTERHQAWRPGNFRAVDNVLGV